MTLTLSNIRPGLGARCLCSERNRVCCTPDGVGWRREELAEGEKKGIGVYGAHPKAQELLTPSLTRSLLELAGKGKTWVWVQGSGPGLNRRPRHLACGARAIRLSPLCPGVLQGSGVVLSVPSETFTFLSPQSANFRGSAVVRGEQTRRDRPLGAQGFLR